MILEAVTDTLRHRRSEGWLVGGSVRDRESRHHSPDLDLVVADDPAAVARDIAGRLASPWFALSARHGAYRVMGDEGHVDVAAIRGVGILDDLARRDFTINAMAMPVGGGDLIDPFGGRTHLQEKRLVAVSEGIFVDDPLRLMRAARFCHVLGLRLDPPLETLLRSQVSELTRVSPERIATEMTLTLAKRPSAEVVRLWDQLGLLGPILPEVASSWDDAVEGGAARSAVEAALERLDHACAHLPSWFRRSAGAVSERLTDPIDGAWTRTVALRLAVMTHRLPPERASAAARRLRLSAAMLSLLRSISACFHDTRCSSEMVQEAVRSPRAAVLFMWHSAPWEPESILLAACTSGSSVGAAAADALPPQAVLGPSRKLMALWADRSAGVFSRPPVDGETLMRELDLFPGPRLGGVLRGVRLAWEAGEVTTAGEAIGLARTLLEDF
jgi:hypothetical protein